MMRQKKVKKGPPPVVYIVIILLMGYAGYRIYRHWNQPNNLVFRNSENSSQKEIIKNKETPPTDLTTEYQQLENSLKNQQWQRADWITWGIMGKLADTNNSGWLNEKEIEKLSCSHLLKIDQLWRGYSREKFGFSEQQMIYENLGGGYDSAFSLGAYRSFAYQVGWINPQSQKMRGGYYFHRHLEFDGEKAPRGHLPAFSSSWISYHSPKGGFVALAEQLKSCQN